LIVDELTTCRKKKKNRSREINSRKFLYEDNTQGVVGDVFEKKNRIDLCIKMYDFPSQALPQNRIRFMFPEKLSVSSSLLHPAPPCFRGARDASGTTTRRGS